MTMPTTNAHFLRLRERSPMTDAELARALGVSKQTVSSWVSGRNTMSRTKLAAAEKLVEADDRMTRVEQALRSAMAAGEDLSDGELRQAVPGITGRLIGRLIAAGELTVLEVRRPDRAGRWQPAPVLRLPDDPRSSAPRPSLTPEQIRGLRMLIGWKQQRLAHELEVSRAQISRVEQGDQVADVAQLMERLLLAEVSRPELAGERLRKAREQAGFAGATGKHRWAELLGVAATTVAGWENGHDPAPRRRLLHVAHVLATKTPPAEAELTPLDPWEQIRTLLEQAPEGIGEVSLLQELARQRGRGRRGRAAEDRAAIAAALERGDLEIRSAFVRAKGRGRRPVRRYFLADESRAGGQRPAEPAPMSAGELNRRLAAHPEMTAGELARRLAVTPAAVSRWRHRGDDDPVIAGAWAEQIRVLLPGDVPIDLDQAAEQRLAAAAAAQPGGLDRWSLLRAAGFGRENPTALAALDRLLAAGQLHRINLAPPERGRPQTVYRPGPASTLLTGAELKQQRIQAGLSQTELARRLGRSVSAVCMWEAAAAKPIPTGRSPRVLAILAEHRQAQAGQ